MRDQPLSRLPLDLSGTRVLDAGCGVGQAAVAMAMRGAEVVAVDLSPNLPEVARARAAAKAPERIGFSAGDLLSDDLGDFDHVLAMDSLIHCTRPGAADAVARPALRTRVSMTFTVAPRDVALMAMFGAGKPFPSSDRSPAIRPVGAKAVTHDLRADPRMAGRTFPAPRQIASGFYISEAMEAHRA